jgi:hypothetical protein
MEVLMTHRTVVAAAFVSGLVLGPGLLSGDAQEMIRLAGRLQWVSGARMQIMSDGGISVAVELRDADQDSYRGLRPGDRVVVDGVVSNDRNRVFAREIVREDETWY